MVKKIVMQNGPIVLVINVRVSNYLITNLL
jgi:hypothetical protein